MDNGFIKINRKILDWEWYRNPNTMRVFIHCLLKANWKEGRFEGKTIPRGSFVSSYKNLANETGLSIHQVIVAINHLILTNEMTKSSTSKYTVFTVVSYDAYQSDDKQSDNQVTNECKTSGNNRRKKEKKERKNNSTRTNQFNLIDQREYDFDELEKGLLEVNQ